MKISDILTQVVIWSGVAAGLYMMGLGKVISTGLMIVGGIVFWVLVVLVINGFDETTNKENGDEERR